MPNQNIEAEGTQVLIHDNMPLKTLRKMSFGSLAFKQAQINQKRDEVVIVANELEALSSLLCNQLHTNEWQEASKTLGLCKTLIETLENV